MRNLFGLIFGSILAAAIVFGWGVLSWMVLPWHQVTMHGFTDEEAVAEVLKANAPKPGMYILPHTKSRDKEAHQIAHDRRQAGPAFFGAVRPGPLADPSPDMSKHFIRQGVNLLVASFLLGILVWMARIRYFFIRLIYVVLVALFAGIVVELPYWNWFEFSTKHTLVKVADLVMGWTFGGVVLAALIQPGRD